MSITEQLNRGVNFHKQGNFPQAEEAYRKVLTDDTKNIAALHLLGVVMIQTKRPDEALASYDKALALKPDYAVALNNRGYALQELKRPDEALASYDKALALKPDYAEALNNRGNALQEQKRPDQALASYDKALALKPDFAVALNNRGNALQELKRPDQALASYDKALALKPDYADALNSRGNALQELKRPDEALASYDKALALKPDYAEALNSRGIALQELKRPDEALASYDKALALKPDYAEALNNRGNALQELKRLDEALASYDKALALKPDYAEALNNRGNALQELKRPDQALASYDKALALKPDYAEALNNRGNALQELKRPDEALASYDKALALKPDYAEALNNRGNALQELKRPDEALASYDKALALKPDYADALNNRGNALKELKRPDEALASYDKALALKPDYAGAIFNRGLAALLIGDFSAGWSGYESRWDHKEATERKLTAPFPVWKGENVSDKKIIVYEEQGLGDVIHFSRYLRLLRALGAQVTFLVRPNLHGLMQALDQTVRVVAVYPAKENFDYQSALLSLPFAFGTNLERIPAETPYLHAEPERARKWKDKLGDQGFKIGIAWRGSKAGKVDIGRSFALAEFLGVSQLPNVRLISLQKNEGVEQLRELPEGMKVETLGDDYDAGDDAFLDTAAVMENLDLIISSDTSIAHLAGALGRPVWVALKYVPDWRWMLDRTDSPWYPSMRLFRQHTRDDWRGVHSDIEDALRELIGAADQQAKKGRLKTPLTPISWGELIDKITILEIKSVEIVKELARTNVLKELLLLQGIADKHGVCGDIADLERDLKAVNSALWRIEDAIREKERRGEFDAEFIELARSVYKRNDERALIKRQINNIFDSELVEEKSYENY